MDQDVQNPLVTRGRMVVLTLLAAFAWLLLSIFTGGTSAVAEDGADAGDGLLGSLTATVVNATVEEVVPVVTAPLKDATTPLTEPLASVIKPVVEPVTQVAQSTVGLLGDIVKGSTAALPDVAPSDPLIFAAVMPSAPAEHEPGPAAVKATSVTPDTRVASVPAAGSLSSPDAPDAPTAPAAPSPAPAPALSQLSGGPSLLASLSSVDRPVALAVASAASADFALPPSPTFDNDSSPD